MVAVKRPEMRDELLRRGAHVGLPEALLLADDQRVEEFLRAGILPSIMPNGGSILAFARTPYAIDRLIALGAPTDARDRWGTTPLDAMSRLGARGRGLVAHMSRGASRPARTRPDQRHRRARTDRRSRAGWCGGPVLMAAVTPDNAGCHWLLRRGASAGVHARPVAADRAALGGMERRLEMVSSLSPMGPSCPRGTKTRQRRRAETSLRSRATRDVPTWQRSSRRGQVGVTGSGHFKFCASRCLPCRAKVAHCCALQNASAHYRRSR